MITTDTKEADDTNAESYIKTIKIECETESGEAVVDQGDYVCIHLVRVSERR